MNDLKPGPAYSGQEPYVFVSYSHSDKTNVYPEIRRLQDHGINVWYDEGIDAGDEWTETLAQAICGSFNFVYFITPNSVQSEYCRRELSYANHLNLAVTAIHLTQTQLPGGLQLSLGNRQGIIRYQLSEAEYQKKLAHVLQFDSLEKAPEATISEQVVSDFEPGDIRKGILVLPFVSRSSEEDTMHICEGIADEVITVLSSVDSLRVISGSAARQIDPANRDPEFLRKLLDVEYLLEGSVQKSGKRLRITAQLPNLTSNEVYWAKKWDGSIEDIFDIQDSIALGVVDALEIGISRSQSAKLVGRPVPDVQAYEYFLRARQSIQNWTKDALIRALEYLDYGEKIIGENAYIISARGYIFWQFHNLGLDPDPEHLAEAHVCIDRLRKLDPESPDAHRLAGLVSLMEQDDIVESIKHLRAALRANQNDPDTLMWLSLIYGLVGRVPSGRVLTERLLKLDPISPLHQALPGTLSLMDGDPERARKELAKCYALDSSNAVYLLLYGQALAMCKRFDEAADIFERLQSVAPDLIYTKIARIYVACMQGDRETAKAAATEELRAACQYHAQASWYMAQCYALIDETDEAVEWIDTAIRRGFWNYPLFAERDTLLSSLRQNDRYKTLMLELKDKWRNLEI
ncbi:MAG: TIR domain-containing protein [Gammaproteobacteria bacterium]|nr:TIR domain-containing protein [Gammaproteobacteria bacterium]